MKTIATGWIDYHGFMFRFPVLFKNEMKKNGEKVCEFKKKHYLCTAFREMHL